MMRQLEKLKKLESHHFLSIYECYIIYKFNLNLNYTVSPQSSFTYT